MKHIFFSVMILTSHLVSAQNDQFLRTVVTKTSELKNIEIKNFAFSNQANVIYESDLNINDTNQIRLSRISSNIDYTYKFQLSPNDVDVASFGIRKYNENSAVFFEMELLENKKGRFKSPGYTSIIFDVSSDDVFELKKCNGGLSFIKNGSIIKVIGFPSANWFYETYAKYKNALSLDCSFHLELNPVCLSSFASQQYATLSLDFPENTTLINNKLLNFFFVEKYYCQDEKVKINIYDRSNVLQETVILDKVFGSNFLSIDINDYPNLNSDSYYLMEFSNINKGQVYYLKVKNIAQ